LYYNEISGAKGEVMHDIKRVIAVINDLDMANTVLYRALTLAREEDASFEVLFVHEEELFSLPEYFRLKELDTDGPLDEIKIKKELAARLSAVGGRSEIPILVYIDDTVDRLLRATHDDRETLIVMSHHKAITRRLIQKSHLPVLVIKNDLTEEYVSIVVPVDLSPASIESIDLAKELFPTKEISLVHDFRALYMEGFMDSEGLTFPDMGIELSDIEKEATKKRFEALQIETGCKGRFITEQASIPEDLFDYIKENAYDLAILGSTNADALFLESLSFDLMEELPIDLLIYAPPPA